MAIHSGISAILSGRAADRIYIGGGLTAYHHGRQVWEICREADGSIVAFVTPRGACMRAVSLNFGEKYTLGHLIHGLAGRHFDWRAWQRSNRAAGLGGDSDD